MQDTKPNASDELHLYPIPAVGVVCWRGDDVLLIRRGRAPRLGEWSIPGGKINRGESLADAALRELFEETRVTAQLGELINVYEIIEAGFHYILIDYSANWVSGEPIAGDDADLAAFMPLSEAIALIKQEDIRDVILRSRKIY
ncbi:hypothetical protein AEAC466_11920 [Asticcacaulis sp. AC466]|uniref:NUDIX hydrolase n=1 Tax=Asticcacaulis sp. AC466 TaxID=1282362 RepID=UPI0003C3B682|nr:NUDIX hydrolase [Asticcacaulis sp. AC466]ESQ83707.1 hypothetical protein AEAC466_11920 [Asticcacaulis sp. AC466]